ncbi:H-NS histone family protein [Undibacterium squillarum]|uniref:Trans-acting regulatory protein hvrA n=1 Tax=Undibacterium squillarum TaxID=1131567 RepID=A0ABQ2Y3A1_9BURK|nr:H-NS histone family protein [Undibacterium squillarum]GGX54728.1 trans-acting regulatory protein hvrA [Undibacterium squillarum]
MSETTVVQNSKVDVLASLEKQRQELSAKIDAERSKALAEIVAKAKADSASIGVSVDELIQALKRSNKTAKGHDAKYANPQNSSEVWAGKGRKPAWLVTALERGEKLESFLLKKKA